MTIDPTINRRQFLMTTSVVGGALVLGFFLPSRRAEAAIIADKPWTSPTTGGTEVNASMIIAEELQCDWTKVRAEYASTNRSLRENRVYQRMATNGSGAVRRSREYLQQAGASARVRLITAAAQQWGVPANECRAEHGTVIHPAST